MSLEKLGWNTYFSNEFEGYAENGFHPARVISQHKGNYIIFAEKGEINGKLSGKFIYNSDVKKDYPVVGDWVAIKIIDDSEAIIYAVLPRKNYFSRKMVISGGRKIRNGVIIGGNIEEQVISSNIDTAFIVTGLDDNFNIGRIERYITIVYSSGVNPVILLNKCDLCSDVSLYVDKVRSVAEHIEIYPISAQSQINMDIFKQYLGLGNTVVFLGSSGVGKSTIVNYLFDSEIQKTNTVSGSSGKGRHTTTSTQLLQHSSGCTVIDTPGIKELQLWADEVALTESFQDIYVLTDQCKYRDCKHDKEDQCAIKNAMEDGTLSMERWHSYNSQLKEVKTLKDEKKSYYNDRTRIKEKRRKWSEKDQ